MKLVEIKAELMQRLKINLEDGQNLYVNSGRVTVRNAAGRPVLILCMSCDSMRSANDFHLKGNGMRRSECSDCGNTLSRYKTALNRLRERQA